MVDDGYRRLIDQARSIYPGMRVGRPGKGAAYWWLFAPSQALRLNWRIRVHGAENVAPGPAILVGNHLSLMDPVLVGVTNRWRLTFFTKVEVYERPGAVFFSSTGQIPLRRGDEESTRWALSMSSYALDFGNKLAIYPEGTRSPDSVSLHRLHRRVLVPVLQANPTVPVHVMSIAYGPRRRLRVPVDLRFSPPLDLTGDLSAQELTDRVTGALRDLGDMPFVDRFAR